LAGLGANHDRFNDRRIDFGVRLPFYEEVGTGSAAFLIFSDYETYGFLPKTLFMASLSGAWVHLLISAQRWKRCFNSLALKTSRRLQRLEYRRKYIRQPQDTDNLVITFNQ
jgi:hypothetical protein